MNQGTRLPKGYTSEDPSVSKSHSSVSSLSFPVFNLFGKEIETQRAGRLIEVNILALGLIALHIQIVF